MSREQHHVQKHGAPFSGNHSAEARHSALGNKGLNTPTTCNDVMGNHCELVGPLAAF